MRRRLMSGAAIAVLLLFLVAVLAGRAADRVLSEPLELGARHIGTLRDDTRELLASLDGQVSLTYFVSSRKAMPSSMKALGEQVTALLEAFRAAAPEKLNYRVLDPDLDPQHGPDYAARHAASPVKLRKVLEDASAEQAIWSSLVVSRERFPDALIQGVMLADLPYLEDLIVEHLRAMRQPLRGAIGVAAPEQGFDAVGVIAMQHERVDAKRVDLDSDDPRIPDDIDVLFWVQPSRLTPRHLDELNRFLDTGRSVVLAGSNYAVETDAAAVHRIVPSAVDWEGFLRPLGLEMGRELLLDASHAATPTARPDGSSLPLDAPFQIRVLPSQYHTRSLLGHASGALLTGPTTVLRTDPRHLAATGRSAEIIATTSESTRLTDWPRDAFDNAIFEAAVPAPKQPWMLLLHPPDRWGGDLLVMSTPGLFRDELVIQSGNANAVFLRTLVRTFTSADRSVRIRVPRDAPEPLPPLSRSARVAWRIVVVFVLPACLIAVGLFARRRDVRWPLPHSRGARGVALSVVVLVGIVLLVRLGASWPLPRADLTRDDVNTPAPATRQILAPYRGELEAELIISDRSRMPAQLGGLESRIRDALRSIGIPFRAVRPDDLTEPERATLRREGIRPFQVDSVRDDAVESMRVWSALRLRRGAGVGVGDTGTVQVIPRLDDRALPHLEFLLASAAQRLGGAHAPRVGLFSDLPRLTPAEAHTDYAQKGYVAPVGADVYSLVREMLVQYGYDVVYVNPKDPVLPADMDLLVWLQPRFTQDILPDFSRYLAAGGKAIVALQHYNVQQRQYRGTGFETVYWPQPQFHRFNDYLEQLGIRQVGEKRAEESGEVLFDRNQGSLELETQVNRTAFREHEAQQVARPFLIRVLGDGLSPQSVITERLGELLFIWGSRFDLHRDRLRERGLSVEVLATTSPGAWTYNWSGGWIPEEAMRVPDDPGAFLDGPQPLAVALQGSFPEAEIGRNEQGGPELLLAEGSGAGRPVGELLLIGCSEMFKNSYLHAESRQHAQFLLNAIALMTHGDELARLQARRAVAESLPALSARTKAGLRAFVIFLAPAALLLYGLLRVRRRRRPLIEERT